MEKYTFLESAERAGGSHEETDLSFEESCQYQEPDFRYNNPKPATIARKLLPWIAHLAFFLASLSVLTKAIIVRRSLPSNCMEVRRQWSITMGSIPEEYHYERAFGTFNQCSSPYKGPPSPAVDAAWGELTDYGAISIPEKTFGKLNASKNAVKVPADFGGGRLAFIEGIHQLHCLEYLWRHTYPDYYVEVAEKIKRNDQSWHEHMDHCVDMLRQKLMCDADVHLLTYNWVKGHDAPHPNFNIVRQCRNYDVIKQYAKDHALDGSRLPKKYFEKPKDGSVMEYEEPPFDPEKEGWPSQP